VIVVYAGAAARVGHVPAYVGNGAARGVPAGATEAHDAVATAAAASRFVPASLASVATLASDGSGGLASERGGVVGGVVGTAVGDAVGSDGGTSLDGGEELAVPHATKTTQPTNEIERIFVGLALIAPHATEKDPSVLSRG
jgi:hypothetical protein